MDVNSIELLIECACATKDRKILFISIGLNDLCSESESYCRGNLPKHKHDRLARRPVHHTDLHCHRAQTIMWIPLSVRLELHDSLEVCIYNSSLIGMLSSTAVEM